MVQYISNLTLSVTDWGLGLASDWKGGAMEGSSCKTWGGLRV